MHTLTIELKQHTPILHFQGKNASYGATLRATELKPKLDRYIRANYKVEPDWEINTKALNYKVKVISCGLSKVAYGKQPMFFGRNKTSLMIDNPNKDNSPDVKLEFFCLNKNLLETLKKLDWDSFFLTTNFGTRQSKGYGSFYQTNASTPTEMVGKEIPIAKNNNSVISYHVDSYFTLELDGPDTWGKMMERISDIYRCIRSGINENGLYFKSLMFAYAKSNGQWWDKRTIKELMFPDMLKVHRKRHPDRKDPDPLAEKPIVEKGKDFYPMFRDLLGLATFETGWDVEYHAKIKKMDTKGEVTRFMSPILFKPLFIEDKWYVFLLHREIPSKFKNTTFTVLAVKDKSKNIPKDKSKSISKDESKNIPIKPFKNFSMSEYMKFLWNVKEYRQYVSTEDDDAKARAEGILTVLDELKQNYQTPQQL